MLGLLYMQVARYADAAQQLETSLKLHPENGEGWATLGSVYNKLDRLPESVAALRKAIELMPDQSDSHLILATVLVKQHDTAGAAQEAKLAADLMRQHMNLQRAQVATNSGKSLLENGKLDDAIIQFRDASRFDPTYVEAHFKLGRRAAKAGKDRRGSGPNAPKPSRSEHRPNESDGSILRLIYSFCGTGLYFLWISRRFPTFPHASPAPAYCAVPAGTGCTSKLEREPAGGRRKC